MKRLLIGISVLVILSIVFFTTSSSPSGYATNNESATVSIDILQLLEITLINDTINFGSCELNVSQGYLFLDSGLNISGANNSACVQGSYPGEFLIRNSGTIIANVSLSINRTGQDFFNDTDSWLSVNSFNGSQPGCLAGLHTSSQNLSQTNVSYGICDRLNSFGINRDVSVSMQAYINASASGGGEFLIYFSASPAS